MAMLDMVCRGAHVGKGDGAVIDKTKGEKETVWNRGVVVFVDFSGVVGGEEQMETMRSLAEERDLEFVGLRAEDVFDAGVGSRLSGREEHQSRPDGMTVDLRDPGMLTKLVSEGS